MIRIILCLLVLVGPLRAAEDSHAGHGDGDESASEKGATFKEGVGITLSKTTRKSIGLTMVEVSETALTEQIAFKAQVYRTALEQSQNKGERKGYAYGSAILGSVQADAIGLLTNTPVRFTGLTATGSIIAVHHSMKKATGQCEVILEVPDPEARLTIGTFLGATVTRGSVASAVVIPRSAILESAAGTFAFVLNGEALQRTAVATGIRNVDTVEILDGLYSGDQVAATAVETLYLIELRTTKGGGHSH